MKKLIIWILIVALLSGCMGEGLEPTEEHKKTVELTELGWVDVTGVSGFSMYRFHDTEKNVTCWMTLGILDSMECLPDSQR